MKTKKAPALPSKQARLRLVLEDTKSVIKQLAAEPTIPEIIEELEDEIRGWDGDFNDPWGTEPGVLLSVKRLHAGIRILRGLLPAKQRRAA